MSLKNDKICFDVGSKETMLPHYFFTPELVQLDCILYRYLLVVIAVIFYHLGCYAEYKLGIEDTARVVPVHGVWYVHTTQ